MRCRSVAGMTNPGSPDTSKTTWHVALLGGYDSRGPWQMSPRTIAISPVGGIDLDLTEATVPDEGATIVKVSLVGGAKLRVPADVNVVVEGFNLIGRRPSDTGPVVPGAPTITLVAYGIFGGVRIERARQS
jgi:Cell wall-active antibiotics response 4TMS YvqF